MRMGCVSIIDQAMDSTFVQEVHQEATSQTRQEGKEDQNGSSIRKSTRNQKSVPSLDHTFHIRALTVIGF